MATFFRRKAAAVTLGVLALTLAGGGIAAAQPTTKAPAQARQTTLRHPGAAQPPVSPAAARQAKAAMATTLAAPATGTVAFAVVAANGTLLQQYQVLLDYDVHLKAHAATIGTNDPTSIPPGGEVAAAPRYLTPNAVFVQTRTSGGSAADKPFHLVVAN